MIGDITEDLSWEDGLSGGYEGLFRRGKERARMYRSFCQKKKPTKKKDRKKQVVKHGKTTGNYSKPDISSK